MRLQLWELVAIGHLDVEVFTAVVQLDWHLVGRVLAQPLRHLAKACFAGLWANTVGSFLYLRRIIATFTPFGASWNHEKPAIWLAAPN
jgi:hypothetical protein